MSTEKSGMEWNPQEQSPVDYIYSIRCALSRWLSVNAKGASEV